MSNGIAKLWQHFLLCYIKDVAPSYSTKVIAGVKYEEYLRFPYNQHKNFLKSAVFELASLASGFELTYAQEKMDDVYFTEVDQKFKDEHDKRFPYGGVTKIHTFTLKEYGLE